MLPLTPPTVRLLVAASAAVLVSACTGSSDAGVDLDGLEPGPCAALVGTLEDVDADLRGLADEEVTPQQAAERFVTVQDDLAAADVDDALQPAVTDLITSLGFFRVSVDTSTYDQAELDSVRTELGALAEECRSS